MIDSSMLLDSIQSLTGGGVVAEILYGVVIVLILYITISIGEFLFTNISSMWRDRVELFPNTYISGSRMYTAIQNPSNPNAKTIWYSDNQRSGVEFSYSMFIQIKSDTFSRGEHKLYHIMHKGYSTPFPLMSPGVFCWGDSNKVRVYMNCYDTWDNFVDVENIPVDKWFYFTIVCKRNIMYIYVNGNLKKKMSLSNNTPPYQNFGNVYLFNTRTISLTKNITTSLEKDPEFQNLQGNTTLDFDGAAKGIVSRVYYFAYALTYTEIQSLMNVGPSSIIGDATSNSANANADMSIGTGTYLSDTWWANNNGP